MTHQMKNGSSRRLFLSRMLSGGAFLCLGGPPCISAAGRNVFLSQHKFLDDSQMSFKEVYAFAFRGAFIPTLQNLADAYGRETFIEQLKDASSKSAAQYMKSQAQNMPSNDFSSFKTFFKEEDYFWRHVLTKKVVEETETAIEVKITECLWAETFRAAGAADIGYAAICHPDFAMYNAFNPQIHLVRTKTLMQGHDCCNHRCEWRG